MEHHMLITAPIAAGTYYYTHSWLYVAMTLFLGFLIDVDHVIDYVREEGKFDMKDMFIKSYEGDFKKLYVIFHAWEFIPLSWIIGAVMHNFIFSIIFSIAYTAHMLPDQLMNNTRPFGYCMSYRIMKGFDMADIFYPRKGKAHNKTAAKGKRKK